ncbi:unnamed protein product [Blepharisma stoltei]|uniref:MULE transposase domain-containing protein n=1 Tax=Blepharisma stoltei TaxID=1481888 RepID=A0AAU9IJS4_9CILI|nr:unnamed protein product [Blepharisma stoltei]
MVPLLWALLPDKATTTYERLLSLIKKEAERIGLAFSTKAFQIDFEMAVINAIAILFPYAQIRGCFFHFSQCLWHKNSRVRLSNRLQDWWLST